MRVQRIKKGIGVGLVLIILGSLYWFVPGSLEALGSRLLYPFLRLQSFFVHPVRSFVLRKRRINVLTKRIAELERMNDSLLEENIALSASLDYMDAVEELTQFKWRYNCNNVVCAQILFRSLSEQEQFFLVDAGSNRGITRDMVAVYKNCLLGKVTTVYPYYCKVTLVTDKGCKVAAYCHKTHATGIYEGCNGTECAALNRVTHFAQMKSDDLIISSGEGLVFPRGFALGKVGTHTVNSLFYDVQVKTLISFADVAYCYLITKGSYYRS